MSYERGEITMDPKACLDEIRDLVNEYYSPLSPRDDDYVRFFHEEETIRDMLFDLVEKVNSLDQWMSKGGFSPWGD